MAQPDGCSGRCDRLSAREVMPVGRFPMLFLATGKPGGGMGWTDQRWVQKEASERRIGDAHDAWPTISDGFTTGRTTQ